MHVGDTKMDEESQEMLVTDSSSDIVTDSYLEPIFRSNKRKAAKMLIVDTDEAIVDLSNVDDIVDEEEEDSPAVRNK